MNVEGLVAAVDAWMNDPCPETEQLIMDARKALASISPDGER